MDRGYYSATITAICLTAIPLAPFLALAILAHKNNRGGFSDPVRNGFNWFKAALWLTVAHHTMYIISAILSATVFNFQALDITSALSSLFSYFGIFALLMSIAQLAVGAHRVDNQQDSRIFITFVRVVIGVTSVLYFAYFIYFRYYYNRMYTRGTYDFSYADVDALLAFRSIWLAIQLLLFIVAVPTTVFSIVKRDEARKRAVTAGTGLPPMRRVWDWIIPATSITIVTTLWTAIYSFLQAFGVLDRGVFVGEGMTRNSMVVVDAIISNWVLLAVFVIVYVLGKKKENGLWSIPEEEDTSEKKDEEWRVSV
ncbi:hypothetical protein V8F20_002114 [Naviculisporaceae sp. PSN 640]